MRVSYDRLWKLMKNNKMTKRDLAQAARFSQYMMGQFTKNEYVSLKEIATLCGIFHCDNGRILPRYSDIPLIFDWPDCGWTLYLLEKMR